MAMTVLNLAPPQLSERVKELQDELENKYNDKCDELDSVNQCFNVAVNKIAELQAELKITDIVQRSKLGKLETDTRINQRRFKNE
jgi:molybdopterin converting factor small subunit